MDALFFGRMLAVPVIVLLAAGGAALLRGARCPGWAVVGGALIGLAMGPSVLGRVNPDLHERFLLGGTEVREQRDALLNRQAADRLVAETTQLERAGWDELQGRHRSELARLDADLASARWHDQRALRVGIAVIVFLTLLGAGCGRSLPAPPRPDPIAAASIGLWSAAIPGGGAYVTAVWLAGLPPSTALAVAAAVAIGPWVLTKADRDAAIAAEHGGARLVEAAGRCASIVALLLVAVALLMAGGARRVVWALPMLGLVAGWSLPRRQSVHALLESVFVPGLAACVGVQIDLFAQPALWPIVCLVLLSGDGRWLGAVIGALLPGGRRGLRTMRLVLGAMATGPTQLAVTGLALALFEVSAPVATGLLLGAILVETTAGSRRAMARRLTETEALVDDEDRG